MDPLTGFFAGVLAGFIVVSIFRPSTHQTPVVPTPTDSGLYKTKAGCVRIKADTTPCTRSAVSLNVLLGK